MEKSSTTAKIEHALFEPHLPDDVSCRKWWVAYGAFVFAAGVPLLMLINNEGWDWPCWIEDTQATFSATSPMIKILICLLYLSVCNTFLPLPTGWIVAGIATREAAIGGDIWTTTLVVATAGAVGSTIANLNEYHIVTWMMRHRHIAKLRHTKTYKASAKWFSRSPFLLLALFNMIPIPVDVVRMLAITNRYPRVPFAGANLIGRFFRFGIIAFITYHWNLGWLAVVALLVLPAAITIGRVIPWAYNKLSKNLSKNSKKGKPQAGQFCPEYEKTTGVDS